MKRAAFYARVSSQQQQEERTIESQIMELKQQIIDSGNVLVKEYIDDGYSGARIDRPAMEELRSDLKNDVFDTIYFHNTDRIARSVVHQTLIIGEIIKYKKQLIINRKDYANSPENNFELTILGAVAELERTKMLERSTRGKKHKLRNGQIMSQGHCILGYDYIKKTRWNPPALAINEKEAKIVRSIFEKFISGKKLNQINRWLEESETLTKRGKTTWRPAQIRDMLKNTTYAGIRYYNRMYSSKKSMRPGRKVKFGSFLLRDRSEWIGVKVPAIVSQDMFDKAQKLLKENAERYRQPQVRQLLSYLIKCGECGRAYTGLRSRVKRELKIGIQRISQRIVYACSWRTHATTHALKARKRCNNKEVAVHILERKVFEMIKEIMIQPDKLRLSMEFFKGNYRAEQQRVEWRLMRIDRRIKEGEHEKQKMIGRHTSGNLSREEYIDKSILLDKELHRLKTDREKLLKGTPLLHNKGLVETSIQIFCARAKARLEQCSDFNAKREFLLEHIDKIIYNHYHVTIIGSVAVNSTGITDQPMDEIKLPFRIESEIDKSMLHGGPRLRFKVDGRLKEWGSGGRDSAVHKARAAELQMQEIKASQITQETTDKPLRTATVHYMAKSYLEAQKTWNKDRDALISNIIRPKK